MSQSSESNSVTQYDTVFNVHNVIWVRKINGGCAMSTWNGNSTHLAHNKNDMAYYKACIEVYETLKTKQTKQNGKYGCHT